MSCLSAEAKSEGHIRTCVQVALPTAIYECRGAIFAFTFTTQTLHDIPLAQKLCPVSASLLLLMEERSGVFETRCNGNRTIPSETCGKYEEEEFPSFVEEDKK